MTVGERLRQLRERKGLSMHRLAIAANVPYPTIWRLEKGTIRNPKLGLLSKVAEALEISIGELTAGAAQQLSLFSNLFPDDPFAEAVFRGYEKLPAGRREEVLRFVQFLGQEEEAQGGADAADS